MADAPAYSAPEVGFDELLADPHGSLKKYRDLTPIFRNGANHYVPRADDIVSLFKDRRLTHFDASLMPMRGYPTSGNMWRVFLNSMLMSSGKIHARRRGPAVDAFSKRVIARLRDYIREEARTLVAKFPINEDFDLLEYYGSPLPGRIIAHVVGLDPDNWKTFAELVYLMTKGIAPPFPADQWPNIEQAAGNLYDFCAEAIAERRQKPQDDFLTFYIAAADKAGLMDAEELLTQVVILVLAGSDTTRAGLAVTFGQLLEKRSRWEEVLADRSLVTPAVSESLRLDPPAGGAPRMTTEDIEIDGVIIPANHPVDLLTISAMRDASLYERPDEFDLHRTDGPRFHLAFGGGVHRCLGEQLAWAELEEGLSAALDLVPEMRLVGERHSLGGFTGVREPHPLIVRIERD
jgi:cytochrome P450 family 103